MKLSPRRDSLELQPATDKPLRSSVATSDCAQMSLTRVTPTVRQNGDAEPGNFAYNETEDSCSRKRKPSGRIQRSPNQRRKSCSQPRLTSKVSLFENYNAFLDLEMARQEILQVEMRAQHQLCLKLSQDKLQRQAESRKRCSTSIQAKFHLHSTKTCRVEAPDRISQEVFCVDPGQIAFRLSKGLSTRTPW